MLGLAVRTLRYRRGAFLATVVVLFCAAALITAGGLLLQAGVRGAVAPERYAGAPIIVSGDQNAKVVREKKGTSTTKSKPLPERAWISRDVAARVRAVPEVATVRAEVDFPAWLVVDGKPVAGPNDGSSWGHAWESAPFTPFALRAGRSPSAANEIVIDSTLAARTGLAPGATVTVQATGSPRRFRVVGIASPGPEPAGLRSQSALFFFGGQARAFAARPGQVAAVAVWPAPDADIPTVAAHIRTALAGARVVVHTGPDRGVAEFPEAADARVRLISLAGTLTAVSLLVALLVVVGTVGLAIQHRQRELALLRAIGATPRQVRTMIGREMLVVALVASVPGSFAGLAVGTWFHDRLVAKRVIAPSTHLAPGPIPLLAAVALTVAGAWSAGRVAGRRAARVRPTAALGEAADPPARLSVVRVLAGIATVSAAVVLLVVLRGLHTEAAATPVALLTGLLLVSACTLLGPPVLRLAGTLLGEPLRYSRNATAYLAAAHLRTNARQLASVAMPIVLSVTIAGTILFTQTTLAYAAGQQVASAVRADYVLSAPNLGVPSTMADAVRRTRGVDTATEIVRSVARGTDLSKYTVQGVTAAGLERTLDLDVRAGSLRELNDATAALSTTASSRSGADIGDHLRLYLGDGTPVTVTVVAVYTRGLGFADITLTRGLVASHVDNPLDDVVLVHATTDVESALERIARGYIAVQVRAGSDLRAAQSSQPAVGGGIRSVMLILIVGFTAIGVVNTLAMSTSFRRREFSALRLLGATRAQIRRLARWESGLLVGIGVGLGTAVNWATLSAFGAGLAQAPPHVPVFGYGAIVCTASVVVFGTTELATRAALRTTPVETIAEVDELWPPVVGLGTASMVLQAP